jgi:hypothetical protein
VKALLALIGWCLLLVLCWPLAIIAIVLWPLVWLLSLPLRLVGITFEALFAFCVPFSSCRRVCSATAAAPSVARSGMRPR